MDQPFIVINVNDLFVVTNDSLVDAIDSFDSEATANELAAYLNQAITMRLAPSWGYATEDGWRGIGTRRQAAQHYYGINADVWTE